MGLIKELMVPPLKLFRDTDLLKLLLPLMAIFFLIVSWIIESYHGSAEATTYPKSILLGGFAEKFCMSLSTMSLSAWLVKYVVEKSIKEKEWKRRTINKYHRIYGKLSLIMLTALNIFISEEFISGNPDYLTLNALLAYESRAKDAGLSGRNVTDCMKIAKDHINRRFEEELNSTDESKRLSLKRDIFEFCIRMDSITSKLREDLIPDVRDLIDEIDPSDKKRIKAKLTDLELHLERVISDFNKDPDVASHDISGLFHSILEVASISGEHIPKGRELAKKTIDDEQIAMDSLWLELESRSARP